MLAEVRRPATATAGVSERCAGNATVRTPSVSTTSSPSESASENASSIVCTGPAGTPAAASASRHSARVRAASRASSGAQLVAVSHAELVRREALVRLEPERRRRAARTGRRCRRGSSARRPRRDRSRTARCSDACCRARAATSPLASQPADWFASIARFACSRSIVTRWPRPARVARYSAASTATVA